MTTTAELNFHHYDERPFHQRLSDLLCSENGADFAMPFFILVWALTLQDSTSATGEMFRDRLITKLSDDNSPAKNRLLAAFHRLAVELTEDACAAARVTRYQAKPRSSEEAA